MSNRDGNRPPNPMNVMWCEYLENFQHGPVSDRTVATVIKDIMFYREALQFLLAHVQSGRRVLKQLCMKGEVPYLVHTNLMEIGETDLAFNVVLSKDLWKFVAALYAGQGVSRRSRDLAFRKAVRQRVWTAVIKMVDSEATSVGNCRRAFLEMVRWEELSLAAELCEKVYLTDGDLSFALRACLRLGRVDHVVEFVMALRSLHRHRKLLTRVVEQSIGAGTLSCFLKLAEVCTVMEDERFVKTMFRLALQSQQVNFVLDFCNLLEHDSSLERHILSLAADVAVKTSQWDTVKELVKVTESYFSRFHFLSFLRVLWHCQEARVACVPFLEQWCADTQQEVWEMNLEMPVFRRHAECGLAHWCVRHGFPHLAFLLCLASDSSVTVKQIAEEYGNAMKTPVLVVGILVMREDDTEGKAAIMKHMSVSDIDDTIILAASIGRWDLVQSLMNRCSQTPEVLMKMLGEAMDYGESEIASPLLHKVDLCHATQLFGNSLLQKAVRSACNREEMVRLCIRSGISTREFCNESCSGNSLPVVVSVGLDRPLKEATYNGQLSLVKLLYQSGATSNEELYRLKTDGSWKTRLETQGRGDIVQYLEQAASSPRSLQDLCRLRVSHLIGCRPGRAQRIESLPLPLIVRDLVSYSDIL